MQYLAVDIGNVILNMEFTKFLNELSTTLNISKEDSWSFLERTQQLHDLGYTLIRNELRDHFKIRSEETIERIMAEWNKTLTPNEGVISWLNGLMDRGVKIALLSNMGIEHFRIIKSLLGDKLYDGSIHFFSCEVGSRKPSYVFYHTFLSMHPEYKESVYLDDNEENTKTGSKFGLNSILFDLFKMSNQEAILAKIKEVEAEIFKTKLDVILNSKESE